MRWRFSGKKASALLLWAKSPLSETERRTLLAAFLSVRETDWRTNSSENPATTCFFVYHSAEAFAHAPSNHPHPQPTLPPRVLMFLRHGSPANSSPRQNALQILEFLC